MYEQVLTLGYDRDKGDAYYRIGFCYMFMENWQAAADNYEAAKNNYIKYRNTADMQARLSQIENMLNGCKAKIEETRQAAANESITASSMEVGIDEAERHEVTNGIDNIDTVGTKE